MEWLGVLSRSCADGDESKVLEARGDDNPDDRDRDEDLPAQAHDLVVAIARECRAEPQVQEGEQEGLDHRPLPAALPDPVDPGYVGADPALQRTQPAAHEQDAG